MTWSRGNISTTYCYRSEFYRYLSKEGPAQSGYREPPLSLGMEAAGIVEAVGQGVTYVKLGDRVSHCMNRGSYADYMVLSEGRVVKLPEEISDEVAAASTLQGLTAQYLIHSSWDLKPGQSILVQAAAGGVGLFLCQWAKHIGAKVFGTVSSEAKRL